VTGRPVITRPSSTMPAAVISWFSAASDTNTGDRDQVTAAEPADLSLGTAFLMRAGLAGMQNNESNP
jgi:hypothetical protein